MTGHRVGRWAADRWVMVVALLVLGYLFAADRSWSPRCRSTRPSSRLSYDFNEFTLDNWRHPCGRAGHVLTRWSAACRSGSSPRSSATVLGTLMAFALVRHRFRGRSGDRTC